MKRLCLPMLLVALAACSQEAPAPAPAAPAKPAAPVVAPATKPEEMLFGFTEAEKASMRLHRDIELGVASEILAGTSRKVSGMDYSISFNRITVDSRCPPGPECVGNGQVGAEISLSANGKTHTAVLSGAPLIWEGLVLVMRDVVPHPSAAPSNQLPRLQVIVDRSTVVYKESAVPGVGTVSREARLEGDPGEVAQSTPAAPRPATP